MLLMFAMLLAPLPVAAAPSQLGTSWNYNLLGKLNSALDPATSLAIIITGSGSFDLSGPSIGGGGGYTILDTGGRVVGSGTWTATKFDSFAPVAPGGSPGEGGRLDLEASFTGTGTAALNRSEHVVVQCSMWGTTVGPPGFPWPPDFVEVGSYTTPKTGAVMFNLNQ
jgi:hypothetical protein